MGELPEPIMLETGSFVTLAGHGDAQEGDLELGFEIDLGAAPAPRPRRADQRRADPPARRRGARAGACTAASRSAAWCRPTRASTCRGTYLPIPAITQADRDNLEFALANEVDYVALSFVRRPEEVEDLKKLIQAAGSRAR